MSAPMGEPGNERKSLFADTAREGDRVVEIEMVGTRIYGINLSKILRDFKTEIEEDVARGPTLEEVLAETFYELCGWERDEDHIDGSYVKLAGEDYTFDDYRALPKALAEGAS